MSAPATPSDSASSYDRGKPVKRPRKKSAHRARKHHSCEPCRQRKVKCDRAPICSNCKLHKLVCVYIGAEPVTQTYEAELAAVREEANRLRQLVGILLQTRAFLPNGLPLDTASHPVVQAVEKDPKPLSSMFPSFMTLEEVQRSQQASWPPAPVDGNSIFGWPPFISPVAGPMSYPPAMPISSYPSIPLAPDPSIAVETRSTSTTPAESPEGTDIVESESISDDTWSNLLAIQQQQALY